MELWVRSQDKEKLLKINEMHLGLPGDNEVWVNNWIVGEYKTREKALEVLDDIESLLLGNSMNKKLVKHTGIRSENTKLLIYEMPEE